MTKEQRDQRARDWADEAQAEAIHVAAMAIRYLVDLCPPPPPLETPR